MLDRQEVERWERLTAAMLRHASEQDPEALAQVVGVLDRAMARLPKVVDQLREAGSVTGWDSPRYYTWAEIGAALGISRQAAWQRFRLQREQSDAD